MSTAASSCCERLFLSPSQGERLGEGTLSGRLEGKVALVTGAGQGIGRATARRLAADGASVGVLDVNDDAAEATASELMNGGARAVFIQADISSPEQVARAVEAISAKLGQIAILANIAGIYGRHDPVRNQDLANWN